MRDAKNVLLKLAESHFLPTSKAQLKIKLKTPKAEKATGNLN